MQTLARLRGHVSYRICVWYYRTTMTNGVLIVAAIVGAWPNTSQVDVLTLLNVDSLILENLGKMEV
jgi:hypothetical protein